MGLLPRPPTNGARHRRPPLTAHKSPASSPMPGPPWLSSPADRADCRGFVSGARLSVDEPKEGAGCDCAVKDQDGPADRAYMERAPPPPGLAAPRLQLALRRSLPQWRCERLR